MDEQEAKLEILKLGFIFENILVLEKYDEDSESGVVLEQNPKYGEKVTTEAIVEIYLNSYKGDSSSSSSH